MPKIYLKIKTFTVEGSGEFPYDMLRYDRCWPLAEAHDSPALAGGWDAPKRCVVLMTCSEFAPTVGRWRSFTWEVLGEGQLRDDLREGAGRALIDE